MDKKTNKQWQFDDLQMLTFIKVVIDQTLKLKTMNPKFTNEAISNSLMSNLVTQLNLAKVETKEEEKSNVTI